MDGSDTGKEFGMEIVTTWLVERSRQILLKIGVLHSA